MEEHKEGQSQQQERERESKSDRAVGKDGGRDRESGRAGERGTQKKQKQEQQIERSFKFKNNDIMKEEALTSNICSKAFNQ